MSKRQILRALVNERLTAAADEIFGVVERVIIEYEEEVFRSNQELERQRNLLSVFLRPEINTTGRPSLPVTQEDAPPGEQERRPSLGQEDPEPQQTKEEQEEPWTSRSAAQQPQGPAETDLKFSHVPASSGEMTRRSQVDTQSHSGMWTHSEMEEGNPLPRSLAEQIKTEQERSACRASNSACSWTRVDGTEPTAGRWDVALDDYKAKTEGMDDYSSQRFVYGEDICHREQQEDVPSLHHEDTHMRTEQEQLWTNQEGEGDLGHAFKPSFTCVTIKSEKFEPPSDLDLTDDIQPICDSSECPETQFGERAADTPPSFVNVEEVCRREQEEDVPSLHRKGTHIRTKQEQLWPNQQGEGDLAHESKPTFTCVVVKSENLEPPSDLDLTNDIQPICDADAGSSECPVTQFVDRDAGNCEIRHPHSAFNAFKSKMRQERAAFLLRIGKKGKRSTDMYLQRRSSTSTVSCCKVCGKPFPTENSLRRHVKAHANDCGLCGKHLEPEENMKLHLEVHKTCGICGKPFRSIQDLDRHMRTHTGEKPFCCMVCGQGFSQEIGVKQHMRIHTGEKPYECGVCGKRFSNPSNITRHRKSHRLPINTEVAGVHGGLTGSTPL